MLSDDFHDPDEVIPVNSPLLQATKPCLEPTTLPITFIKGAEVDDYRLDTPWIPHLRVSGRAANFVSRISGQLFPSPVDAVLVDYMGWGRDPSIGAVAHRELLDGSYLEESSEDQWPSPDLDQEDDTRHSLASSETVNDTAVNMIADTPMLSRRRWGMPLSLGGPGSGVTVMSCVDSGADDNTMTLDEALRLGLTLQSQEEDPKEFYLANGKVIKSLGKVVSPCEFVQGNASHDTLVTFFYVFQTLVEPIIIGLKFLELTETLSKHRDRLVELEVPLGRPIRVLSIGVPRRNLFCHLDQETVFANADSGSDLDFISQKYARSRNISISHNREEIMFADGSIMTTSGVARLSLSIEALDGDDTSEEFNRRVTVTREFHIFDGMVHDVLIGHETIEKLKVFTRFTSSLLPGLGLLDLSSLNIIRHLRSIPSLRDIARLVRYGRSHHSNSIETPSQDDDTDQLENARRSMEMEQIENSTVAASPITRDRVSIDHMTHRIGSFVCHQPGCNAAPFQTQYLLNAHATVHSPARPHFCPVKGCPRSVGGKGFKRKNEMIRHGLVHESPGYVCPFCPDLEHKYPRPDNLERHVRVHHTDKDKDDSQLREVLAQRPDGPNRGRRRRGVP